MNDFSRTTEHAAVILAGGDATRMGGVPKPDLMVGGRSLLRRVLDAVPRAQPRVVVGDVVKRDFILAVEDRPRSGPAYAIAAGLEHVPGDGLVVVLAGDLPFLTSDATAALRAAVTDDVDGAVFIDHNNRRQWLCGAWRRSALGACLTNVKPGTGVRHALGGLRIAEVTWLDADLPVWFDCDTPASLEYARGLDREFRR